MYAQNYKILLKVIKDLLNGKKNTVFIDWKTKYSKDADSPQLEL